MTALNTLNKLSDNKLARWKLIANAVLFQLIWFVCVQGDNVAALLATGIGLTIHWCWFSRRLKEWSLVLVFISIGIVWESIVSSTALIRFSNSMLLGAEALAIAPLWLVCLWAAFAITLKHSMAWLANSTLLRSLLCFVFVPCSYYAGALLSNSAFPLGTSTGLAAEAFIWAILLHWVYRQK